MPDIGLQDAANLAQALGGGMQNTALMSDQERQRQAQLIAQQMQQARLLALQQMAGSRQVTPPQSY